MKWLWNWITPGFSAAPSLGHWKLISFFPRAPLDCGDTTPLWTPQHVAAPKSADMSAHSKPIPGPRLPWTLDIGHWLLDIELPSSPIVGPPCTGDGLFVFVGHPCTGGGLLPPDPAGDITPAYIRSPTRSPFRHKSRLIGFPHYVKNEQSFYVLRNFRSKFLRST